MNRRICVVGDGAWGTALAQVARMAGNVVTVWSRKTPDLNALQGVDAVVLAVPAQSVRDVMQSLGQLSCAVVIAAKGIERNSGLLMAEVVKGCAPLATVMVLSGPSFASDVLKGLPTAVTLAAAKMDAAAEWAAALSLPTFRIYKSDDVTGVEIGGALKNVLAIACGISDGKGFGESARAALITRGFAELLRLGRVMGAKTETMMGLSGLGDLMLTCASPQSRNYGFGFHIGRGQTPTEALKLCKGVIEGAATAAIAWTLAQKHSVDMPITRAVYGIIDQGEAPDLVISGLLARPASTEFSQE
jgi:glycerol-3-phosphate dehydrogenase (NAD(P)+)